MIKQYGDCIAKQMKKSHGIKQPAVYFDIWKSMNGRLQQRLVDPRIDIATAPWSPWRKTPWLMPLLANLTIWRSKIPELRKRYAINDRSRILHCYTDFPGYSIENVVPIGLKANLTVLDGEISVNVSNHVYKLMAKRTIKLPTNTSHNITVVSQTPAVYFYRIENSTLTQILAQKNQNETQNSSHSKIKILIITFRKDVQKVIGKIINFLWDKGQIYHTIALNTAKAIYNILENENATNSIFVT